MIENSKNSWNSHWINLSRKGVLSKVFVFVRKNIIAKDVASSLDRYFPPEGIFLDSGCGTSQTSISIPKRSRKFIAMDISDIIFKGQPSVVDYRVNGDVLRLPFKDESIDGVWNVGLMEHFKPHELGIILGEFRRVLKSGGYAVFFWPAYYGPVNLLIKSFSFFNAKLNNDEGNMFPEEPSLLKSKAWVGGIVRDSSLSLVKVKRSLRGAFIHHAVVVRKP